MSKPRGQKRRTVSLRFSNLRLPAGSQSINRNIVRLSTQLNLIYMGAKTMRNKILLILMCVLLSACGQIVLPVKATTDKDEVFTGELKASLIEGSAHLTNNSGITCNGTYDQFSTEQVIMMYMSCSDGRHGKVVATRDLPLGVARSGTCAGKMNDGTQFTCAWGKRIAEMPQ